MAAAYNPLSPGYRGNPYPHFRELREEDPVHWFPAGYCWVLTKHEHVKMVLTDRRFGIGMPRLEANPALKAIFAEPFNKIIRTQLLASDPPDHPRIRSLAVKAFAGPAIDGHRLHVQRVVDELIDRVEQRAEPRRRMDFVTEFAYPLPFTVICDILNVPRSEREPLEDWTHKLMRTTDPTPMTGPDIDDANEATIGFRGYFLDLARERRKVATDDLFSELVAAVDRGDITEEELIANTILIFCAGHDTVVNLFGNGLLALHRNPDQLELLRRNPSLLKNAVEELLRYDASVQIARRMPFEAVEIGGRQIGEGQYILCMLGAANRDPAVYPDPDRLDITRPNIRPMSFGGGIHYCLGALLARLEGEVVFGTLLRRCPDLHLETLEPEWNRNVFVRGIKSLPVRW